MAANSLRTGVLRRPRSGRAARVSTRGARILTLAAVALCAVGVPLPSAIDKLSDARFPCERHACGCAGAEACWRDCCCMSQGAKLAWAERAGVTPPAYVVAAAARAIIAEKSPRSTGGQCCRAQAAADTRRDDAASGCCKKTGASPVAASVPQAGRPNVVAWHAAMACRGLRLTVAVIPPSLPVACADGFPPPVVRFLPVWVESLLYEPPAYAPVSPPPDCSLA